MEIFFAASKIRAMQIRAMRNRASRGMTVLFEKDFLYSFYQDPRF